MHRLAKFYFENPKGRDLLRNRGKGGTMILKWNLKSNMCQGASDNFSRRTLFHDINYVINSNGVQS